MPDENDISAKVAALEKALADLKQEKKDIWDKLSALSGVISGVVIAALGLYFTHSYNDQQLALQRIQKASEQSMLDRQKKAELDQQEALNSANIRLQQDQGAANRELQKLQSRAALDLQDLQNKASDRLKTIELAEKFFPHFTAAQSSERDAAFEALLVIDPKLTGRLINAFQDLQNPFDVRRFQPILSRMTKDPDPETRQLALDALDLLQQPGRIEALVNAIEFGTPQAPYDTVRTLGPVLFYGRLFWWQSLHALIEEYCRTPGAKYASTLQGFVDGLSNPAINQTGNSELIGALKQAATDPVMQHLQDAMFTERVWVPSLAAGAQLGLRSALGMAIVFDYAISSLDRDQRAFINASAAVTQQLGGSPSLGVDEHTWIRAFLDNRTKVAPTNKRWGVFLSLARQDNWNLKPPISTETVSIGNMPR